MFKRLIITLCSALMCAPLTYTFAEIEEIVVTATKREESIREPSQ